MGDLAAPSPDRSHGSWGGAALRPFESSWISPVWIGLGIGAGYLLLRVAFDAVFLAVQGFPPGASPVWRSEGSWAHLVNAALIGYLPAALAIARRGVLRDLAELRPRIRLDDAEFEALRHAVTSSGGPIARALSLSGIALGAWLTFFDPSSAGGATPSPNDPIFLWSLLRNMLIVWLVARLSVYDFNMTRTYVALGLEDIEVDLLDIRSLAPFARRGQRSALIWVLFSSIFSLFWLGGYAGQVNLPFLVMVLSMATLAFAVPIFALRHSILASKDVELDRLREEIREARMQTGAADSPRLANSVAYYRLVESGREWPIDAANLLKFIGYLLLGLGSWLGGALVERILDTTLPG